MCQNIFKNSEETKRKEVFTKLFATLVSNSIQEIQQKSKKVVRK